eukprot:TRINITY_DN32472_c0_g1_i1.p1 TRINITY_DN32472_c0_g1~~TRINITY_DN32472_c0_g1_i1.p1  ORF type:complete len:222 (+),score=54.46 TRINITY_DN32472_c0_g1_i1:54-668(+)
MATEQRGAEKAGLRRLPTEVVQLCVGFATWESLFCLRLASRRLHKMCPAFGPPREVYVRYWCSKIRKRTAMYIPRGVRVSVNGYVTLAGLKARVLAAEASVDGLEGHVLIPGPDKVGVGGGGVLKGSNEQLQAAPAYHRAASLYLVPPPLEVGVVAPLVVIPKHGNSEPFLDRSEFRHVAPQAAISMLSDADTVVLGHTPERRA